MIDEVLRNGFRLRETNDDNEEIEASEGLHSVRIGVRSSLM